MADTILTNARLVLGHAVLPGTLVMRDGRIDAIDDRRSTVPEATDLDGDILMPGVVDLHTDNLERQVLPRAGARWPSRSAMIAHDSQCAAAGITTVFDALCVGDLGLAEERVRTFHDGVADLDALAGTGLLRSEHFLHLRCELPARDMLPLLEPVADHPLVRLASLMDHTPGVGQNGDLDRYRAQRRREGGTPDEIEAGIAALTEQRARLRGPNRAALLARLGRAVVLASHDDRTRAEIAENDADGIRVSEFPVSLEAATEAKARRMEVIAGAPNIVRGGSHSGNVSAIELVRAGTVTALASDYVPASLIEAAFALAGALGLAEAIALVTARPARMVRLDDRGEIAVGRRADLIRVRLHHGLPMVREVWRGGARVA